MGATVITRSSLVAIARRFNFVREVGGANTGAWVSLFQRFAGGEDGESWCCDFESYVEMIAYRGRAPGMRTGSCQQKLDHARGRGWVVTDPRVEDLYFFINAAGHAHHIGIVTAIGTLTGIAGNTSEDGASSNGTGVFEHTLTVPRSLIVFVRLPSTV